MACRCCAASALQSLRGMLTICLFPTQLFVQTIKQRHRFKALCYVLLGISLSDMLNTVMLASFEITSQSLHFILSHFIYLNISEKKIDSCPKKMGVK